MTQAGHSSHLPVGCMYGCMYDDACNIISLPSWDENMPNLPFHIALHTLLVIYRRRKAEKGKERHNTPLDLLREVGESKQRYLPRNESYVHTMNHVLLRDYKL